MTNVIAVKHNIEVAHRLFTSPGKCQQIHGHSMWVTMEFSGNLDSAGFMNGLEFGAVKKTFREHLDTKYDHGLLLNADDDWARPLRSAESPGAPVIEEAYLPGLRPMPGDPTTENIALWIANFGKTQWGSQVSSVTVWETAVNMARWER